VDNAGDFSVNKAARNRPMNDVDSAMLLHRAAAGAIELVQFGLIREFIG
jgi:hypothetical protein